MDRRKSIKALAVGTLSAGTLLDACKTDNGKAESADNGKGAGSASYDRQPAEQEREKELNAETFFTKQELATITVLCDIIIPADDVSGSASDAKVPDFIEFIVKDKPEHQVPMRGGLRWLDIQSLKRNEKPFSECSAEQQLAIVNEIAWPNKAKPEMAQGVSFFSLMRNLTATGFFTSAIGLKDLGYVGNRPNQWNGVPNDVLRQYNLQYDERELNETVKFDNA
jgi:gluconate 2-dehydrogenase gamma chain